MVPYFSFNRLLAILLTRSALERLELRMPERRDLFFSNRRSFSTFVKDGYVCTMVRYSDKLAFSSSRL